MSQNFSSLYIFEGLSPEEISYFYMMAETKTHAAGVSLIKEGEGSNDRAFFVVSGSVDVFRDGEKIAHLGQGELFGELALITNEKRSATVKTAEKCEILSFAKEDFLILYKRSELYEEIKAKIFSRIRDNFYQVYHI